MYNKGKLSVIGLLSSSKNAFSVFILYQTTAERTYLVYNCRIDDKVDIDIFYNTSINIYIM